MCSTLATTLEQIMKTCAFLGYNVTQDNLGIVDDLESKTIYRIQNSLPVLVMPYWDNCLSARLAIPGWDGSACMFRLAKPLDRAPILSAVNRDIRESKTLEWLNCPNGKWANGWYEDRTGMKWYSDVINSETNSVYGTPQRQFNMLTGEELICTDTKAQCFNAVTVEAWSPKFSSTVTELWFHSISISNGQRFGFFLYNGSASRTTKSIYDWETLLTNVTIGRLLFRWVVAMAALHRGYLVGVIDWHTIGLSSLANASTFQVLPFMLLPRLKMALFAFWPSGCEFEGQQLPISETWFLIYPSIIEVLIFYYSVLNWIGKLFRYRVSDVGFSLSVIFFCLLHWSRGMLAGSRWLEFDGRVTSMHNTGEFQALTLIDFATTSIALRINGSVRSLFFLKVGALAANFVVPFGCSCIASHRHGTTPKPLRAESILAIRLRNAGGLSRSPTDLLSSTAQSVVPSAAFTQAHNALSAVEILRLGYVVYGNEQRSFLIKVEDWEYVTLMAPLRNVVHLWDHRVKVFELYETTLNDGNGHVLSLATEPMLCRLDDPRFD